MPPGRPTGSERLRRGGREHALAWALAPSARVFCGPGNPGTAQIATNVPLDLENHQAVIDAVRRHQIDLTVIGPEAPLAAGLADALARVGHHVFGPTAQAARIESSKAFAKEVMEAACVPTARSRTFTSESEPEALSYVADHPEPLVVKASGLAAGKGAVVCRTRDEAKSAAAEMFGGKFGDAGLEVLIEEYLEGEELSVFALTDGEQVMLLPAAQDHKRLGEGDVGPNTGGMGAYTPVSIAADQLLARVEREIIVPVLRRLAEIGSPYRGVLYGGLMIDEEGDPKVLEFNCRFGDPEAQAVLPAADLELADHLWRIAAGETWHPAHESWRASRAAVTTVLAAPGYPGAPVKGAEITIPAELPADTLLFHAGSAVDAQGTLRTAGGRIFSATGLGATVREAAERSRELAQVIEFEGKVYRRDIAWREARRAGAS
ncbi:MAG: phosphoribosylamine--glycine ligase [Gemmatimonadales bacterium]